MTQRYAFLDAGGVLVAHGFVESNRQGNTRLAVPDDFAFVPGRARWTGDAWEEYAPPAPVPQSVTRFQAKAALAQAGKLAAAQALVDASTDPLVKLAWSDAATFERQSPMLLALAPMLWPENTAAELDALFVAAAGISA